MCRKRMIENNKQRPDPICISRLGAILRLVASRADLAPETGYKFTDEARDK